MKIINYRRLIFGVLAALWAMTRSAYGADLFTRLDDRAVQLENPATYEALLEQRKDPYSALAFAVRVDAQGFKETFISVPLTHGRAALFERHAPSSHSPDNYFSGLGISSGAVQAKLYLNDDSINGSFSVNNELFFVKGTASQYSIIYPFDESKRSPMDERSEVETPNATTAAASETNEASERKTPLAIASPSQIASLDILVVYPPQAAALAGGAGNLKTMIQNSNSDLNRAMGSSQVFAQSNLVSIVQVNFAENSDFQLMLNAAKADKNIENLRKATKADIVVVMTSQTSWCGRATLASRQPETAFAIVSASRGCSDSLAFAHEIGHILGADHDPANATLPASAYPYGHGYIHQDYSKLGCYKTVMSYSFTCNDADRSQPYTISYFSTPNVVYLLGHPPIGNAVSNNAKAINENVMMISAFSGGASYTSPSTSEASLTAQKVAIIQTILGAMLD